MKFCGKEIFDHLDDGPCWSWWDESKKCYCRCPLNETDLAMYYRILELEKQVEKLTSKKECY